MFVYFGHYMLTLPPPAYVDIAHTHGVKILGTLIFEWDAGKKEAEKLLGDAGRDYARKMAEICKEVGFDGYLMNFECQMDKPQLLIDWLRILREEMRTLVPEARIIWYDSVLQDSGELRWQSALTPRNCGFMQVTDGFFTDYHWKAENLQITVDTFRNYVEKECPNLSSYDIFVGNDCYGRGTYGGGRFNIHKAIKEINKYPLSISLFG